MEVGKEGDCVYIYKTNKNQRKTTSCIYICLSLHCHHQNGSYIKMGSDESHFNVSFIVRDTITSVHKPQLFLKRRESRSRETKLGPSAYQSNVLPEGQTASRTMLVSVGIQVEARSIFNEYS